MATIRDQDALDYHSEGRPGKVEVTPSKPCLTQRDLSLAYTPGVAVPCLAIQKNPSDAYRYTSKGNLVAVISNGTAVLGLGNIGALAGKPVMEGKGVLFKRFADIDVFDIEIATEDPEEFINAVRLLEPTFGGINLEDVKAPECFLIEERLKAAMSIPVFHDDQHGTAIISGAALLNACEISGKDISKVRVVFSGAGAAGIACAKFFLALGVRKENVLLCDSKGVVHVGRDEALTPEKRFFAQKTKARTIGDAMKGADVFCGVSIKGLVTKEMVKSMAKNPIVFAMANPDPEIGYDEACSARSDIIMATGRSDFPNQVNNVLGFPFIFRGALDTRARSINEEMKLAAAHALARLAKEDVPDSVAKAYGVSSLHFGREYIIPKPFDPRVLLWEAPAVAKAAMKSGVAREPIDDMDAYVERLERILGKSREVMRVVINKAKRFPARVVFPEALEPKVLRACQDIRDQGIAEPVLVGDDQAIRNRIDELHLDLEGVEIQNPATAAKRAEYARKHFDLRCRKGATPAESALLANDPLHFGLMLLREGDVDGLVCGVNKASYPETIRPALQIIGLRDGQKRVAGMYLMVLKDKVLFFADATVNIEPTADDLAEIALLAADAVRRYFDQEPRVAMLSFSNFGSSRHPFAAKVAAAVEKLKAADPTLVVDGEMQADTALVPEIVAKAFPHSAIKGDANILIFPDLQSGNVAYKLVQLLGRAEIVGPIIMGLRKPVSVLNHHSSVQEIVNITALTAVAAGRTVPLPPRRVPAPVTARAAKNGSARVAAGKAHVAVAKSAGGKNPVKRR
ncbi:MAG: NADP-dependent malic enzyme [Planctomycetes bacterium]|nr:NADP-dependent malic enzyme [Planctomycetota bacterium]MBI3845741.1 NADP-dependent malic enzyme [Planctomycetota bacterium]